MNETKQRYLSADEVIAIAHRRGLTHVKDSTIKQAAYVGHKPLQRTLVAGRVYYTPEAVEKWLAGENPK